MGQQFLVRSRQAPYRFASEFTISNYMLIGKFLPLFGIDRVDIYVGSVRFGRFILFKLTSC